MRYLLLTLLIFPLTAHAIPVEYGMQISPPTTRQNGTALKPTDLAGYELYYAVTGGGTGIIPVAGGTTTSVKPSIDLAPREQPYVVSWRVLAVDKEGLKSPLSAAATSSRVVSAPTGILACRMENAKLWAAKSLCESNLRALRRE
jgi:hypothetical protein